MSAVGYHFRRVLCVAGMAALVGPVLLFAALAHVFGWLRDRTNDGGAWCCNRHDDLETDRDRIAARMGGDGDG